MCKPYPVQLILLSLCVENSAAKNFLVVILAKTDVARVILIVVVSKLKGLCHVVT